MKAKKWIAPVAVLALLAAACGEVMTMQGHRRRTRC